MSNDSDNARLLEDFEDHWVKMGKDIETTEMSLDDVRYWEIKFDLDRTHLIQSLPGRSFTTEVDTRINRIKNKFDIAILKGKANYRENEKIRLKDSYGLLAPLIYIILKPYLRKIIGFKYV